MTLIRVGKASCIETEQLGFLQIMNHIVGGSGAGEVENVLFWKNFCTVGGLGITICLVFFVLYFYMRRERINYSNLYCHHKSPHKTT